MRARAGARLGFADYVKGIRFAHFQPGQEHVDLLNTRLPVDDARTKGLLATICAVPHMSTFAIAAMIQRAVSDLPDGEAYVNVGVWYGFSLLAGMLGNADKRCIGVDNFSQFGGPRAAFSQLFRRARSRRHRFFEMDYGDYFAKQHEGAIGVYFFDGPHAYRDQYRGLARAEPFFAPGAKIFVDDTNWDGPRKATLDFMKRRPGRYRLLLDQRTSGNGHLTFWNGVMVLEKVG